MNALDMIDGDIDHFKEMLEEFVEYLYDDNVGFVDSGGKYYSLGEIQAKVDPWVDTQLENY